MRTKPIRLACILVVLACSFAVPARAETQGEPVRVAIERFYTAPELSREWFSASFLAAVPFEQIPMLRDQLTRALGSFEAVRADGDRWLAVFEKGSVPTLAEIDGQGRFVGLRLLPPIERIRGYQELSARFDELPGRGTLLVRENGIDRIAHDIDHPFAVGSAFKFVVLRALAQEIHAGRYTWEHVVSLEPGLRSIGGGTLERWPDGARVTLYALAAWMISESDNTATDVLIHVLGRERVEAADPGGRNRPFLSTREAFVLKDPTNESLLVRWRAGDEAGRRALLEELALVPLPTASIFATGPRATDVEWFYTARELCDLIEELQTLDLMTINPGVVAKSHFARVAFKGGSEPGVLNLTTWVRTLDGRTACVCATQNAEVEIDTQTLGGIVGSAFELVRKP